MLIRSILLALLISAAALSVFAQSSAPENDFQVWNETTFTKPLQFGSDGKSEKLSLTFGTTVRMFDEATRVGDWRLSTGLDRKINSKLTLSGGYTFRRSSSVISRWENEHRIRLDGNLDFKANRLSIRSRSRFERMIKEGKPDSSRFRQRILLSHPLRMTGSEIFSPFASAELFYDITARRISRGEYIAGISRKISSDFTIEPFVGLRKNRSSSFRNVGIVGINMKFKLSK